MHDHAGIGRSEVHLECRLEKSATVFLLQMLINNMIYGP